MKHLRGALVFVFLIGTVVAAAGIDVRATYGAQVTADEPQYLLTAISLAEDRSLDISDEIAHERFLPFHEIQIDRQTEPLPDGSEISPHDPGLPALLAGPMRWGGWRAAKATLAMINGLLASVILWTAVRRFGTSPGTSTVLVAIFAASAPFAVYGNQVYPEIVAALATAVAIAALMGRLGPSAIAVTVASVVALSWLSVKYAPVGAAIALVLLVRLWREHRRAAVMWSSLTFGVMGAVFVVTHLHWYGGPTPYATGDHFVSTGEFSVIGTNMDLLGRSRRLVGLLTDNTFGLIVWQPLFVLGVPAIASLLASGRRGWGALCVPLAAGWLNATFVALTMQGWWWPGRQVVVVLPALVIAICWWVDRVGQRRVAFALGSLGVVSYAWLVVEGLQGRITWVVDFFETRNPIYRVMSSITPDYLNITGWTWALHAAWLVGLAVLGVLAYGSTRTTGEGDGALPLTNDRAVGAISR